MLAIAAILVFIWFYKTALKNGLENPWIWATGGIATYYITGFFWVHWVIKPTMGSSFYNLSPMEGALMELSGIAVALLVVFGIKKKFLHQTPANEKLPFTDS